MEDETKFYIYTIIITCFYLYLRYGKHLHLDYFDTGIYLLYSYVIVLIIVLNKVDSIIYNCLPLPGLTCLVKENRIFRNKTFTTG